MGVRPSLQQHTYDSYVCTMGAQHASKRFFLGTYVGNNKRGTIIDKYLLIPTYLSRGIMYLVYGGFEVALQD